MEAQERRRRARTLIGAALAGFFLGALIAYLVAGDDDEQATAEKASTRPVAEVAQNPADYYDRELTLRGQVQDVLGARAVVIGPPRRLQGARRPTPR